MTKHYTIFIISSFLLFTSCITNTTELNSAFAGAGERSRILSVRLNEFHRAVYWHNQAAIAQYVKPEAQPIIRETLKNNRESEKLVDIKIENIVFDQEIEKAEVETKIRYYKTRQNVVKSRNEKEIWEFDRFNGGWKLSSLVVTSKEVDANLSDPLSLRPTF